MRIVMLTGTEAAPGVTGTIVISTAGESGTLVVDGLPSLDEARQYQLWLIRDGQRTSGGVFSVNPDLSRFTYHDRPRYEEYGAFFALITYVYG